jgi:hypothetical protein
MTVSRARLGLHMTQSKRESPSVTEKNVANMRRRTLQYWIGHRRTCLEKHRFPDATHRFQAMNPTYGRHDYHQYSSVAHGDLAITAKLVREKEGDLAEDPTEPLWRILAACQYSLQLATRVSELRDVAVEHLPGLWEMFAMFGTQFDAYQIHVASRAAAHDEAPPEP